MLGKEEWCIETGQGREKWCIDKGEGQGGRWCIPSKVWNNDA